MKEPARQPTPEQTQWVEVKEEAAAEMPRASGSLYIEYGALHMTADSGYPVESLSALLREMCAAC